jgi:hypothetical protein
MNERRATKEATERNMDISVVVYMQTASSGELHGLHGAANQFLYLPQQTLPVSGEIPPARNLDIQLSVLLHQPAI